MAVKQVIIANEKHADRILDASTPGVWARAAFKLLKMRYDEGYWYYEPEFSDDQAKLLAMTDEEVAALPTDDLRSTVEKKRAQAKRRKCEYDFDMKWWTKMKEVVDNNDLGIYTLGQHNKREVPKAWVLLKERNDYEYEHVELVSVEQA